MIALSIHDRYFTAGLHRLYLNRITLDAIVACKRLSCCYPGMVVHIKNGKRNKDMHCSSECIHSVLNMRDVAALLQHLLNTGGPGGHVIQQQLLLNVMLEST